MKGPVFDKKIYLFFGKKRNRFRENHVLLDSSELLEEERLDVGSSIL